MSSEETVPTLWLVYDGECPICRPSANALKIKAAVGKLELVNAREPHPILAEIRQAGLDINEGMVVKFNNKLYHGTDAQHFLALVGTTHDWINRLNYLLFRNQFMARIFYPVLRFARTFLLSIKGIPKINLMQTRNQPIFESVFGNHWKNLPEVFHKHYANRPNSRDVSIAEGSMTIEYSGMYKLLSPLFGFLHLLPPGQAANIPVTVTYRSHPDSSAFELDRRFRYPNQQPYRFRTRMIPVQENVVIELIRFGFGWRMQYQFDGKKVILQHHGYVFRILNHILPLPLQWLMGKIHAEEEAVSTDTFRTFMTISHPLFGHYTYNGVFKMMSQT